MVLPPEWRPRAEVPTCESWGYEVLIALLLRRRGVDATSAHEVGNGQLGDRAQLDCATREGRAIVTRNVVDFLELARDAVATNTRRAGIILIPSSFRGDEYQAIADAIVDAVKPYPKRLELVLHVKRRRGWAE